MLLVRGLSFDSEFSPLEVIGLSCLETYFRTALILRVILYLKKIVMKPVDGGACL